MKKKVARVKILMLKSNLNSIRYNVSIFDKQYNAEDVISTEIENAVNTLFSNMLKAGIDPTTIHLTFTIG